MEEKRIVSGMVPSNVMKKIMVMIACALAAVPGFSQQEVEETTPAIKAFARNYGDSIAVRWSPNTTKLWAAGMDKGYLVYKTVLLKGEAPPDSIKTENLTPQPIRIASQEVWEQMMEESREAEIAAVAIFGEGTPTTTLPPGIMGDYYAGLEKEGRMVYALMAADLNIKVAKAEGLFLIDKQVDTSLTYLYTIAIADSTLNNTYTVGSAMVDAGRQRIVPAIEAVEAEAREHKIYLSWKSDYQSLSFSSFDVYRSTELEKGYAKLNELPVINAHSKEDLYQDRLTFLDSVPKLNTPYYYVVVGHTLFGDIGPYNSPLQVISFPRLKAAAQLNFTEVIDSSKVKLSWTYPEEHQQDVAGFIVKRAKKDSGPYVAISEVLNQGQYSFIDEKPFYNSYYHIAAFNAWGDTIHSLTRFAQIIDTEAPAIPTGLTGEMDSTGIVTLHWKANREEDILGYRVYSGNYANEEFSRVTPKHITDTVFIDTVEVKTLTKSVYYSVVAIDKRYNPSKFTPSVEIKRPDVIPPTPPVIKEYKSSTGGVLLTWVKSSSSDVKYHEVWREIKEGEKKELLYRGQKEGEEMSFKDSTAHAKYVYQYQVIAVDESGLKSVPAGPVTLQRTKDFVKPGISQMKLLANSKKRMIKLGWVYNEYGVKHFLLYRAKGESKMTIYKNISAAEREFYDKGLSINTTYAYSIKAVFDDGSESPFSEIKTGRIE